MHTKPILPAGVMIFLVWKKTYLLILRDNKTWIQNPNTWCPVTGGVEEGETFFEAITRELEEEIGLIPQEIKTLGVSAKGNCFFFGRLSNEEKSRIILGEGQEYGFRRFRNLHKVEIRGAFRTYLDKFPRLFRMISEKRHQPDGKDFGLANWDKSEPDSF